MDNICQHIIASKTVENPDINAARVLREAMEEADKGALPENICDAFSLFISETVTNIIKHNKPIANRISFELSAHAGSWICRIKDDGPAFNDFSTSLANAQESREANKGEQTSGMGLALISSLLPDFWYESGNHANADMNTICVRYPARSSVMMRPHIVVVDDDFFIRLIIRTLFGEDYFIRSYPDAFAALAHLHDEPVDLVISDIQMPGIDGLEFRRKLTDQGDDHIPFIFLTANTSVLTTLEADNLGIDGFIDKKVIPQKLKRTIDRLLQHREAMRDKLWNQMKRQITDVLEPKAPARIGAFNCTSRNRVASAGGGDICLPISDNGLFFADIMGHGVQAKLIAHSVSAYVRSLSLQAGAEWELSELFTAISDAIEADETFDAIIVSALMAKAHPDGFIEVASAGHPFPVHLTCDGAHYIEICGPLLGMSPNQEYETIKIPLDNSSALMFLTDGLFELSNSSKEQQIAENKIYETALNSLQKEVEKIADNVISVFDEMTGYNYPDDATFLIIKG